MYRISLCILLLVAAGLPAAADLLSENFDDVSTLAASGWVMVNNSTPAGSTGWFQGNSGVFPAYAGPPESYIAANFNNAGFGGNISNWLLTPVVPIAVGDTIRFATRSAGFFPDRLEVRLSTNGASSDVGASDASVGDFDTLLLTINPALTFGGYPDDWMELAATLSAPIAAPVGRYAFRYVVPDTLNNADYIGIDSVSIQRVPEPASIFAVALPAAFAVFELRRRTRKAGARKLST